MHWDHDGWLGWDYSILFHTMRVFLFVVCHTAASVKIRYRPRLFQQGKIWNPTGPAHHVCRALASPSALPSLVMSYLSSGRIATCFLNYERYFGQPSNRCSHLLSGLYMFLMARITRRKNYQLASECHSAWCSCLGYCATLSSLKST